MPPALRCPNCRYDLTGLSKNICPECGGAFTPEDLMRRERRDRRRHWMVSSVVIFFVTYAPYSWLLVIDYPWSDYHRSWIKMWLALPVLLVGTIVGRRYLGIEPDEGIGLIVLHLLCLALVAALIVLSRRRWRILIIVALIVLVLSSINSWGLYNAFRA